MQTVSPRYDATYKILLVHALGVALFEVLCGGGGGLTPPGNVWTGCDFLALAILLGGSCLAALHSRARLIHLLYGVAAGIPFWAVLGPDSRDLISIAMRQTTYSSFVWRYFAFLAALGLACLTIAVLTHRITQVPRFARGRCGHCGYDLTGNLSGACPECGTPIADEAQV